MFDKVVSKDLFILIYCPDRYKTQRMCDEAVDDCLTALKLLLIGLLQVKCFKNFMML